MLLRVLGLLVLVSCVPNPDTGSTETEVRQPVEPATTSNTSSTLDSTTSTSASSTTTTSEVDSDLVALRGQIDQTVARRTAAFTLEVAQTLPTPGPNGATLIRRGVFDDQLLIGQGTVQFEAESDELAEELGAGFVGEAVFEFRLHDDVFWFLNPIVEPPTWLGFDVLEYATALGADPTLSMDGDLFILAVGDAVTEVTGYSEQADGSGVWSVTVEADDLLPLVTTGGVQQRIYLSGFESTGLDATAEIQVDGNGMVTAFGAELDDWWQQVVAWLFPELAQTVTMQIQFELDEFDLPIDVASPCEDPSVYREAGFPEGLTCEG